MGEWQRCGRCGFDFVGECDSKRCVATRAGIAEGRRLERERIVEYMRKELAHKCEKCGTCTTCAYQGRARDLLDEIERGEHEGE